MLVRELMTSPAVTVAPEASAKEALRRLAEHGITAMPVVDGSGALVGVVSEADLIRGAVLPDPRAHEIPVPVGDGPWPHRVADVMSHVPLSVRGDADLTVAVELMTGTVVKSLPVVQDGVVVGVVSRRDVVAVLARGDDRIEAEVDGLLRSAELACTVAVRDGIAVLEGLEDTRQHGAGRGRGAVRAALPACLTACLTAYLTSWCLTRWRGPHRLRRAGIRLSASQPAPTRRPDSSLHRSRR